MSCRASSLLRASFVAVSLLVLAGCKQDQPWHEIVLDGALPRLSFQMQRVSDGSTVTGKDYLGKIVIMGFGFTHCEDVCPTTLANLSMVLDDLGPAAHDVRVLFVTVDPTRDTEESLRNFVGYFAPQVDGLRGNEQALAVLAKRYRLLYSVTPEKGNKPYEVTHGAAVYVFDRTGKSRLLVSDLFTERPDIPGLEQDIARLLKESESQGVWSRLIHIFG